MVFIFGTSFFLLKCSSSGKNASSLSCPSSLLELCKKGAVNVALGLMSRVLEHAASVPHNGRSGVAPCPPPPGGAAASAPLAERHRPERGALPGLPGRRLIGTRRG